jgi:protoporphyrinogen oxidase
LIIGAGPAGLTAALKLVERGVRPRIYEASEHVGGLARTVSHGDWRVDPGGHRFFTKNEEIMDLWRSLLPADQWISVQRKSAMLVDGHLFTYPLVGRDLLMQLGARRGLRGLTSFLWSRFLAGMRDGNGPGNFREWGEREFGPYWYKMFFDSYVRKTWLADPNHIPSDWANQRIKPINWRFRKEPDPADQDAFLYPRLGPGQLWDAAAVRLVDAGVVPHFNKRVEKVRFDGTSWTVEMHDGETVTANAVLSTMPLRLLVKALEPAPPQLIQEMAAALGHRSMITVCVALRTRLDVPYNWVYTPSKELRVGRVQNYGQWSNKLAPDNWQGTYLGFEYYGEPGGELYTASDERMKSIVHQDLRTLGIDDSQIEQIMVDRMQFAYPAYDDLRDRSVEYVRDYLTSHYPSLHPMGRNGMHHYDNQDHAMLSAMQSVAHYFGASVNPWQVNTEICYHESGLLQQ